MTPSASNFLNSQVRGTDMLSAFALRKLGVILSGPGAEFGLRASSFFWPLWGEKAMVLMGV